MAASEETSEKEDERATIFFFFFGWKFDLRSLYDSYGYGFIFAPDLFPRNGKSYYGTSEPCFLANSLTRRGNCFRLFDLRSKLTIRNSFSIRSRKSIRLALIGGFIAIHFFYFFFPPFLLRRKDGNVRFLFETRLINCEFSQVKT